jgi:hypothetical protein
VRKRPESSGAVTEDFRVKRLGFRHIQEFECVWAGRQGRRMGNSGWRLAVGGWPTRCRANVQIGAMLLCKGAKVSDSFRARDLVLNLKART